MDGDLFEPMIFDFSREDIPWENGRKIYSLWQQKCSSDRLPARSDFTPHEMASYLDHIMLMDVHYDPMRFKVRLTGTKIDEVMGANSSGYWVHDMRGGDDATRRFSHMVERRQPYFAELPIYWADKDYKMYDCILLPLADDGAQISMILCLTNFTRYDRNDYSRYNL